MRHGVLLAVFLLSKANGLSEVKSCFQTDFSIGVGQSLS